MEILSQIKFSGTAGTGDQTLSSNGGLLLPAWKTLAPTVITPTPYSETPAGLVNGTNTAFTLVNTPAASAGVIVIINGGVQFNGIEFTVTGNTINFIQAPAAGSVIHAYYNTLTGAGGMTASTTDTLNNKSISLGTNTITGTKALFNTALTDGDFLYVGDGVTSLSAIGTAPNANGATIAAGVLTLQPASASFGGVLSSPSVVQTIGGNKTFQATDNSFVINNTGVNSYATNGSRTMSFDLTPGNLESLWVYSNILGPISRTISLSDSGISLSGPVFMNISTETTNNVLYYNTITNAVTQGPALTDNSRVRTINFVIDGGGAVITTGSKGFIVSDFAGTIVSWTVLSSLSGSCVVDVKKSTYTGFPTTTSIAGTAKPTLVAAQKNQTSTLTGWTTAIDAGDVLEFNVDSAATVTRVTVSLKINIT